MAEKRTERQRLTELHQEFVRAYNEGDLETLSRIFHPEALVFHSHTPKAEGWKAYRRQLEEKLTLLTDRKLQTSGEVIRVDERLDDRIAWIAAHYSLTGVSDGGQHEESGRWTTILEKMDDAWQIVHFHISED